MAKNKKGPDKVNGEFNYKNESRFTNPQDLYTRFSDIESKAPKQKTRDNLIDSYDREPTKNPRTKKLEPNHGQFTMKVDNHIAMFIDFLTETPERFRVNLVFETSPDKGKWEDLISGAFKEFFLEPWGDMYVEEMKTMWENAMFGKGVQYWADKVGYKSESMPTCDVFPNLMASMRPRDWDLLFIRKPYSLVELYNLVFGDSSEGSLAKGWNQDGVDNYLLFATKGSNDAGNSAQARFNRADVSSSVMESTIYLLHCYVKEYKGKKKKITKFIIPSDNGFFGTEKSGDKLDDKIDKTKFLFSSEEYYECMSNCVAVRTNHIQRSYWSCKSFADLIYLSCKFYDQATNAIIRSAIRNMTLFLKSSNPDSAERMRKLGSSEVEVIDKEDSIEQNQIRTPVAEMTQVVRQVMFDSEKESNQSQAAGSQNVKGYAITAEEVKQRQLDDNKSESTMLKSFVAQDRDYYTELYRRAIEAPNTDDDKYLEAFKAKMAAHNIPESAYAPENVVIKPVFNFGGSRAAKISFAQSLLSAVSVNASTEAQMKAKSILISAHVGSENVDQYINEEKEVKNLVSIQVKAGRENEDMDNPALNPENVPVSPDDKHPIEVMFHIKDYQFKLSIALNLIKQAQALPVVMKVGMLMTAKDLIIAQDNKGAHIEAHFKYWQEAPNANKDLIQQTYKEFEPMRASQDQMQKDIEAMLAEYVKQNEQNIDLTEKQKFTQAMNQETLRFTTSMNDIALGKALEQKDLAKAAKITKVSHELVSKEQKDQLEIDKQEQLKNIEIQKKLNDG